MLKAELHCHIEGAAPPRLVQRLARKNGIDLHGIIANDRYVWDDFTSFLACYDAASSVFRDYEDYRLLACEVFCEMASQGAIYGEVFVSPDVVAQGGPDAGDYIAAIAEGIKLAGDDTGIEGRMILTAVRHLGPQRAEDLARHIAQDPHPMVTGFGLAGDERMFDVEEFSDAFATAEEAGLGLTAHAGEFAGPESVRGALDHLGVTRIGHGVRAIEDEALIARLAEEGIVLEICEGSNIALGVYPSHEAHPLRTLVDRGVKVTLNSDDPPFFDTSLEREYDVARTSFGFDDDMLEACTRTAIEAAFVDEPTRARLLARLDAQG